MNQDFSSLPTRYNASEVEQTWYQKWEAAGLFKPSEDSTKDCYTITIPPPNITGSLHMGHALCYSIHDLLGRYWRLQGKNVWIIPGQDHAGIATQSIVDKQLRKEGQSATKIGREKFIEKVWQWREESGNTILHQMRQLGCSFDWSATRFTLDKEYANAVLNVFVDWFNRGIIYKGKRVVNWDPALQTSISDIETERKTVKGKLYHIRYPFTDGSGEIVIATTRPETLMADVAVAVNPSDTRYKHLIGKMLELPLFDRQIPLISDPYPDPKFGTGALKITPAHDANDYEVGMRHNLPMLLAFDPQAKVTKLGGVYAGLTREKARKQIVEDLEEKGYLVRAEDYEIALLISDRSGEIIEPLLSEQWFVKQKELAQKAIEVLEQKKIELVPERFQKILFDWLMNIRDWCISRQLWWGHQIPIYYTEDGKAFAALSFEEAQTKAGDQKIVRQDDDVLDTWFSSGLWPFALLGWPNDTPELKKLYPTSVLVTDRNILSLWVARMIMMGLDLVKEIPFHEVFIYATVLTEDGRRMSKSLGTGVDPMEIIPKYGTDALRYALLSQTGANQDIRYSERKVEEARNFCNKIWNAARFVLINLEGFEYKKPENFEVIDHWLLTRLFNLEKEVTKAYQRYDLQFAAQELYKFFWLELCDWYIEVSKPRLQDPELKKVPLWVLLTTLESFLKMLHPIMPHVTEEVYHYLPLSQKASFLMDSTWPQLPLEFLNQESQIKAERWFSIIKSLRALRAEIKLTPLHKIPCVYYEGDLKDGDFVIRSQAWIENLILGKPEHQRLISMTIEGVDFYLPITGLIDETKELERLAKEEEKLLADLSKINERLSHSLFLERAKPEIIEQERSMAKQLAEKLEKVRGYKLLFETCN